MDVVTRSREGASSPGFGSRYARICPTSSRRRRGSIASAGFHPEGRGNNGWVGLRRDDGAQSVLQVAAQA
ncbi:MAG: hypothetical protein ACREPF_12610, partial [Rhodanobacteraceae bacterium]